MMNNVDTISLVHRQTGTHTHTHQEASVYNKCEKTL